MHNYIHTCIITSYICTQNMILGFISFWKLSEGGWGAWWKVPWAPHPKWNPSYTEYIPTHTYTYIYTYSSTVSRDHYMYMSFLCCGCYGCCYCCCSYWSLLLTVLSRSHWYVVFVCYPGKFDPSKVTDVNPRGRSKGGKPKLKRQRLLVCDIVMHYYATGCSNGFIWNKEAREGCQISQLNILSWATCFCFFSFCGRGLEYVWFILLGFVSSAAVMLHRDSLKKYNACFYKLA